MGDFVGRERLVLHRSVTRLALAAVLVMVAACSSGTGTPTASPTASSGYDAAAAAEQARTFHTMASPDDWANYGEQVTTFCNVRFGFDCNREDRDLGEEMSSGQEVQQWDAERSNPQSVLADIGILFIPQAQEAGLLADYEPPNASLLPADLHGPGWVTTFVGVPTFIVNVGFLESKGLPIPESWADLTNPAYSNPPLVGLSRPGVGSSGTWAFVAMNKAAGGSVTNWQPGIEYGKELLPNIAQQAQIDTFERGEVPISIRFDFAQTTWIDELDERGVNYKVVVPSDGSVYAQQTLMMNKYDTAHADLAKMFMEWVLTDEGQVIFSKFGARPIRSVAGESRVTVPAEARVHWLPDEQYANVESLDWTQIDSDAILDVWENQVVGGS
jgi:putative spermidine/putrescine transport system substrate-binding protein